MRQLAGRLGRQRRRKDDRFRPDFHAAWAIFAHVRTHERVSHRLPFVIKSFNVVRFAHLIIASGSQKLSFRACSRFCSIRQEACRGAMTGERSATSSMSSEAGADVPRRPSRRRPAQDPLQPLRALEGIGAFDRIFAALDADRAATGAVTIDTGPPQSAPHRGELGQKSCSPPHRPHQRRPERCL